MVFTVEIIENAPEKELQDNLGDDLIAIVTSFAARLYVRRLKRFQEPEQRFNFDEVLCT